MLMSISGTFSGYKSRDTSITSTKISNDMAILIWEKLVWTHDNFLLKKHFLSLSTKNTQWLGQSSRNEQSWEWVPLPLLITAHPHRDPPPRSLTHNSSARSWAYCRRSHAVQTLLCLSSSPWPCFWDASICCIHFQFVHSHCTHYLTVSMHYNQFIPSTLDGLFHCFWFGL